MKPIKLQFVGLNSYRTRQEIDFEVLGADGLFGIFGPTGSGKSSILDAITLALYGGVDRASNNTRGIINQLEKSLEVSFQFELGEDRYLVERRYDRNPKDHDAAVAKQARLRKFASSGEEVLASKPQEVTTKIEAILGIGKEEFLRAVVLPQGKFDQFLRLTGGDRAAMLEHLFNLKQYGEELVAKVKNEAAAITEELQRISGEELGLGDCSAEAVNQAVLELKTKKDRFNLAQQAFTAVDQSYQEIEIVRELYAKRKTALEKLNRLEQERVIMDDKETRLHMAEQAEPLRVLIARHQELTERISEESIIFQKKADHYAAAVTEYEAVKGELKRAEKEYQEQIPHLQERKALYQAAQGRQEKLKEVQPKIDAGQRELDRLRTKLAATAQEVSDCQSNIEATRVTLDTLQQDRAKLIINPDEKERIENALTALANLEESEKRYRESEANYGKRKIQSDAEWDELVKLVHQMLPAQSVAAGDDLEQYSRSLRYRVEKKLEEVRKAQQRALLANAAAELVKQLHNGEPCPVCGSREHPSPVRSLGEPEQIKISIETAEDELQAVRDWEDRLVKAWHNWRANETLVNEAREQMEKAEQHRQMVLTEFEKVRGAYERGHLRERKKEWIELERQLHQLDQKRDQLQKIQQQLVEKLEILNESFRNDKISEASLQADLANLQSRLQDFTEELNQITGGRDLNELIRALVRTYERLEQAVKDAKEREGETRVALEKLSRESAALEATLRANRNELAEVEERLTAGLKEAGFTLLQEAEAVLLEPEARRMIRQELERYRQEVAVSRNELEQLDLRINERPFEEGVYEELKAKREKAFQEVEQLKTETALAEKGVEDLRMKQGRWKELQRRKLGAEQRKSLAEDLLGLLRGRRFVSFLAQEHLRDMTLEASYQLGRLTGQRYALELAKDKDCEFVIRDDYNGGARRMINSLSGGEIFMTSLALALALSSKIQLRGKYPLGFFFLDEGFGSLDQEKLDKVMTALEKLRDKHRMVGVISHVRELKERLPRYLEVMAAGEDGSGSRIKG
jgi:exonuclease SbcC